MQMLPPMGQVAVLPAATAQSSFLTSESCLDCAVTPCRTMSHKLKTSHNSHATNITCHYSVTAPLKFWSQHSAANSRVLKTATLAELRSLFPSTHLGRERLMQCDPVCRTARFPDPLPQSCAVSPMIKLCN